MSKFVVRHTKENLLQLDSSNFEDTTDHEKEKTQNPVNISSSQVYPHSPSQGSETKVERQVEN